MHLDIKKFWEESNNKISGLKQDSYPYAHYWYRYIKDNSFIICAEEKIYRSIRYYIDGKSYSEEEMLKIIKLGIFW